MTELTSLRNNKRRSICALFYGTSLSERCMIQWYSYMVCVFSLQTGCIQQANILAFLHDEVGCRHLSICHGVNGGLLGYERKCRNLQSLFTWFIPATGRKTYWKHIVARAKNDDNITTISNEAFVLLVLENNWDCWLEIFQMNDGNLVSSQGRGKRHIDIKCNIQPKYT